MSHNFEPTIVVRRTLILNIPQKRKRTENASLSSTTRKPWRRAENLHWPLIPFVTGAVSL